MHDVIWSLVSLMSGGGNTYSCNSISTFEVYVLVWETQKRINININHSYHQRPSLLVVRNWSNDSDSVLTNIAQVSYLLALTVIHEVQFSEGVPVVYCFTMWFRVCHIEPQPYARHEKTE